MKPGHPPRANGFTLVELLVGLFIFGLMAAAGTSLLASAVNAGNRVETLTQDSGALARTTALMTADCAQAIARPWRDVAGQVQPAFRAGGSDGSLFTLVRGGWANPAGSPRASLQRVRYGLEDGKLVRHGAAMLDGTDDGPGTVLLSGVASARLRLLGPKGWQEGWSGSALPRAVELTLAGPELGEVRQLLLVGTGPGDGGTA